MLQNERDWLKAKSDTTAFSCGINQRALNPLALKPPPVAAYKEYKKKYFYTKTCHIHNSMVLSDSGFKNAAKRIKKMSQPIGGMTVNFNRDHIEKEIYSLLTKSDVEEAVYSVERKKYEHKFKKTLEGIDLGERGTISSKSSWCHFIPNYAGKGLKEESKVLGFKVTHKRYYTIAYPKFSADAIIDGYLIRFVRSLDKLFNQLYDLAIELGCRISFKVPNSIDGFLDHFDTIVIHFTDGSKSKRIHEEVLKFMKHNNFLFGFKSRHPRVDKGFDLAHDVIDDESHSSLLAIMIADWLFERKERVKSMTTHEIESKLRQFAENVSGWPPNVFISKLKQIKGIK